MKHTQLKNEIADLFEKDLELEVPAADTDLMETGYLDSLRFVQVLVLLEKSYGMKIKIEELEIEHFRSIERIAEFIGSKILVNHDLH